MQPCREKSGALYPRRRFNNAAAFSGRHEICQRYRSDVLAKGMTTEIPLASCRNFIEPSNLTLSRGRLRIKIGTAAAFVDRIRRAAKARQKNDPSPTGRRYFPIYLTGQRKRCRAANPAHGRMNELLQNNTTAGTLVNRMTPKTYAVQHNSGRNAEIMAYYIATRSNRFIVDKPMLRLQKSARKRCIPTGEQSNRATIKSV